MANEYLKRTPTSTGNRKVFTISIWSKLNDNSVANTPCDTFTNGSNFLSIRIGNPGTQGAMVYQIDAVVDYSRYWEISERDFSGWSHHLFSFNSTSPSASERVCYYLNGIKISNYVDTYGTFPQNFDFKIDTTRSFDIFKNGDQNLHGEGEIFDYFFVDGQALTPDVFGYYKKGDGYISAGSTQATDFKKGQWVPKAPKVIKSVINARGGFGVNGFYLPMNDDSNFGADFHCEPNSIIKLKGEEDPQPRNGAPETTDAYVSQLRTDPYAANLVLAVPGISTATGPNLITNGTFENGTTGWTISNASHGTMTVNSNNQLLLSQTTGGADGVLYAWQAFTTEIGKRYTVSVEIVGGTASSSAFYVNDSSSFGNAFGSDTNNTGNGFKSISFQATGTTTYILLRVNTTTSSVTSIFDNVVIKQENVPRDYSADIKGSGNNKLIVPAGSGTSGVGYKIPSYYNSAIRMKLGTTYGLLLGWGEGLADYNFGTGDFTMEAWVYTNSTPGGYWSIFRSKNYHDSIASPEGGIAFYAYQDGLRIWDRDGDTSDLYASNIGSIPNQQWTHVAVVRHKGRLLTFCNGVCVGNIANVANYTNNGFEIGQNYQWDGYIKDARIYKGVAKYKGGFDVPKPYTPVGIGTWRAVPDTTANNFATLNPLDAVTSNQSGTDYTQATHSNGNLTVILSDDFSSARGSIGVSSGKYYWEVRLDANTNSPGLGVIAPGNQLTSYSAGGGGASYEPRGDRFRKNGVGHYDGTDNKTDDGLIVGVALDKDAGSISFYADGALLSNGTMTGLNDLSDVHIPECFTFNDGPSVDNTFTWNFGQNPTFSGQTTAGTYTDSNGKGLFKYAPPTGFLALCEDNLPTPAIADPGKHFKSVLYTGDGNDGRSITGVGFKPDFVWIKRRASGNQAHAWHDVVRGPSVHLETNTTDGDETNNVYGALNSFDNDGFSIALGSGGVGDYVNTTGNTYVAWCWKAGGPAVSNTDGSITSQVSVNQDAGFSIVSYTGNATDSTVGHGLNKTPGFIIVKKRNGASDWPVYHQSLATQEYLVLNLTAGKNTTTELWYQDPTSSVFYIGDASNAINASGGTYIAYCWAEIEGFSKFGSYIGNQNADGPFVYCGFKPAFVMVKSVDRADSWGIFDSSRDSVNPVQNLLRAEGSNIEATMQSLVSDPFADFLSNGFKIRNTSTIDNYSGEEYIFMAFAESPFQTANAK